MIKTISIVLLILAVTVLVGQTEPDTLWTRTYGSIGYERGNDVVVADDGGYVIAGYSSYIGNPSNSRNNAYVLKTDSDGYIEWEWYQDDVEQITNYFNDLVQFSDGYAFTGRYYSPIYEYDDVLFVKLDSMGTNEIIRQYDIGNIDIGYDIINTSDGFYITGTSAQEISSDQDILVIKTDYNGNMQWSNTYGDINDQAGRVVYLASDQGILIVGTADSDSLHQEICLLKINSIGDSLWYRTYGGPSDDYGVSVKEMDDGGLIILGETCSYGNGQHDAWLLRTDSVGDTLWTRTIGGNNDDRANDLEIVDDCFVLTGYTKSFGTSREDLWVVSVDFSGNVIWSDAIVNPNYKSAGISLAVLEGKNIVITGSIGQENDNTEIYLLKYGYPFTSNFYSDTSIGYLPNATLNFFDDSFGGVPDSWQWDFQNDGIYDAFEQNPSYTYTQPGTYSVKLKVSSETMVDSLVKVDYITVTYVPPKPPENVEIAMVGNDAHIEWDAVTEDLYGNPIISDYYFVYYNGSNNVDGEYYFHGLTTDTNYVHANVGLAENTMFYRVEAVVMLDRSQDISRLRRGMSTHEVGEIIGIQTHPKPLSSSE